mmetsp:Transcript_20876/g.33045  ORF Transcript_20876/g.33045 Transcript_20876/m.33045 type:complete len:86 (-) Transcript_20876:695-952(-)
MLYNAQKLGAQYAWHKPRPEKGNILLKMTLTSVTPPKTMNGPNDAANILRTATPKTKRLAISIEKNPKLIEKRFGIRDDLGDRDP